MPPPQLVQVATTKVARIRQAPVDQGLVPQQQVTQVLLMQVVLQVERQVQQQVVAQRATVHWQVLLKFRAIRILVPSSVGLYPEVRTPVAVVPVGYQAAVVAVEASEAVPLSVGVEAAATPVLSTSYDKLHLDMTHQQAAQVVLVQAILSLSA